MRPIAARTVTCVCALALALACAEDPVESVLDFEGLSFSIVSGDGQVDAPGKELRNPLVVQALDHRDKPVKGQLVGFVVVAGGGSMFVGSNITDEKGLAQDYLTLGPEPGENVVEVRAVHPSTGEKHVFARFTATAKIPTDEVCNGSDDDLDGEIDEDMVYCIDGQAAPNTDGANSCQVGWEDTNGDPADGCETALTPTQEVCNGVDDDFDGSIDEEMFYCLMGTPAWNTDGENSCLPGWYEVDGLANTGCEGQLDLYEPNNSLSEAYDFDASCIPGYLCISILSNLVPLNDEDWFSFSAEEFGIDYCGPLSGAPRLVAIVNRPEAGVTLYDAQGQWFDGRLPGTCGVDDDFGVFYVRVHRSDYSAPTAGYYRLEIQIVVP